MRLLLKSGADSSLKNYHNDTPVMVAKNKKVSDRNTVKDNMHIKTDTTEISFSAHYLPFFMVVNCCFNKAVNPKVTKLTSLCLSKVSITHCNFMRKNSTHL